MPDNPAQTQRQSGSVLTAPASYLCRIVLHAASPVPIAPNGLVCPKISHAKALRLKWLSWHGRCYPSLMTCTLHTVAIDWDESITLRASSPTDAALAIARERGLTVDAIHIVDNMTIIETDTCQLTAWEA